DGSAAARRRARRLRATAPGSSPTWSPRLRPAYRPVLAPPGRNVVNARTVGARGQSASIQRMVSFSRGISRPVGRLPRHCTAIAHPGRRRVAPHGTPFHRGREPRYFCPMEEAQPKVPAAGARQIAAVDLGSNSFHMVIARVDDGGELTIIDRLR